MSDRLRIAIVLLMALAFLLAAAAVLFAQEPPCRGPRSWAMDTLMVVGIGEAGADVGLSIYAFQAAGARELNPALAPLSKTPAAFGFVSAAGTGVGLVLTDRLHDRHPRWALLARVGIVVAKGAVIAWNIRELKRAGR
jgi:hypothetical protein